jgi:hypothetical protein
MMWLATAAAGLGGAACLAASPAVRAAIVEKVAPAPSAAPASGSCAVPASSPHVRYADVAPVFEKHCNRCHDKNKSDNMAAMRVFESSSYPFSTERPDALLGDLREMFESRGGLSEEERCVALRWVDGGGLDDSGAAPRWRP